MIRLAAILALVAVLAVGLVLWRDHSNNTAADRWNALSAAQQHRIYRADPEQTRLFLETVGATMKP